MSIDVTLCWQALDAFQLDLQIHYNSNQNPSPLFCVYQQADSKLHVNTEKSPEMQHLREKKTYSNIIEVGVGTLKLPDFEVC